MKYFIATTVALGVCLTAHAQVAYNNFGSGDTYQVNVGDTISNSGSLVGSVNSQGWRFTSATTGSVSNVTVAMAYVLNPDPITFTIYANNAGVLGSSLGSFNVTPPAALGNPSVASVIPSATINLVAGQDYWLVAAPGNSTAWASWLRAPVGNIAPRYSLIGSTVSYTSGSSMGAFRVETVPEPMTMTALALGAGLLLRRRTQAA